jgi:hypothetical protein
MTESGQLVAASFDHTEPGAAQTGIDAENFHD